MCGSEIQYIKNVTSSWAMQNSEGVWSTQLTGMPSNSPNEVVIRSITFSTATGGDDSLYYIWSNLTNDFIGSFMAQSIASTNPQTRLWLTAPIPNVLEFKLYTKTNNAGVVQMIQSQSVSGDISIQMDMIKYRNMPSNG